MASSRHEHASGRSRASWRAVAAAMHATAAPAAASNQKWLAVTTMTKKTASGYVDQRARAHALRTRFIAGTAIISEKAMCMLGTAAYGLTSRLVKDESWFVLVNAWMVSVNPAPGNIRGGAVGNTA